MAEKKSPGADFVARIVKDPANPPQTVMLTGYVGASSEKGHTRLYFDPGLSSYVEIPDDAILHSQDSGDAGGLGGTHLWVRRDAELIYGPAGAQRPKGKFLEGPIMQAAAQVGVRPTLPPLCGQPPITLPAQCRSDFVACQTWICPPTPQAPCLSHAPCPSVPCPPTLPVCPSETCVPSTHIACPPTLPFCPSEACQPSHHIACPTPSAVQLCPSVPCLSRAPCPSVPCPPTLPLCPSEACQPSQHIACPTPSAVNQCPSVHCVSQAPCPSVPCHPTLPFCPSEACQPSQHIACPPSTHICPTPSAVDQCPSVHCVSPAPQCPPVSAVVCDTVRCGIGAPGVQAAAVRAAPMMSAVCPTSPQVCGIVPPSLVNCPTHAPQFCPVTPQCPPTPLGRCPTHAPLLCPVTPQCPPTPIVHCPTQAPQLCPITPHCVSVFIACVTQNVLQCIPPITTNPAQCPIATGFNCPQVSLDCPVQFPGGNPGAGG